MYTTRVKKTDVASDKSTVMQEIQRSLANDPQTSEAVIEVINEGGIVTLQGEVDSVAVREQAEAIARDHAEVVSVVNSLKVRPQ